MPHLAAHPADFLHAAIARCHESPICVGLDPVLEQFPAEVRAKHHEPLAAVAEFCRGVLTAISDVVPAVKFQSACFERYGSRGVQLLEELSESAASMGLVVVWDAKRGDIGVSAAHYAAAARRMHAHFVTVNGYLGASGVEPFVEAGLGVFVLVRTSNVDSDAVQSAKLADGRTVAESMAAMVSGLGERYVGASGWSSVGAVVGATKASDGGALRARMPGQYFLIPGYGAQGGRAADVRMMLGRGGGGVLVTSSRAVIYAPQESGDESWTVAVRGAAERMARELAGVVRGV